jgi:hypothetical protein
MKKDDEPNVWITVAKLVIGAIVLIGGTGLALWYADSNQQSDIITDTSKPFKPDWGIATDSPLRR